MARLALTFPILAAIGLAACSDGAKSSVPQTNIGLIGDWQSADDENYVLKLDMDNYREFYENEEMSRDKWQPVKSCDDTLPVEKTASSYGGFHIWTKETDDRICYAISNWTVDAVSLTYAGTTASYTRIN